MRRVTAITFAITFAITAVAACASAGAPPGGPERHTPPNIVSISVDSGQTNVKMKSVEFKFDEVVSDRPAGVATGLDQIFLISPREGAASVSWHRTRVDVRPRRGFQPNTAYRITMLPGLVDLRNNVRKDTRTVLFSTGPTFPPYGIIGVVFDWAAERPAIGAYIEAISRPDTNIVYVTAADSLGQFDVGPLPAGQYTVRAIIDQNSNRILDRNEKWDSTSVTVTTSTPHVELDAIERDSTPPIFESVSTVDSVTLRASFDKAIDPGLPLRPALFTIQRADSSALGITSVQWAAAFDRATQARIADSLKRAALARTDTTHARPAPPPLIPRAESGRAAPPPPKPRAPAPEHAVIITLSPASRLVPGARYSITAHGFRNLVGNARDSRRIFTVPKPEPRDTVRKKAPPGTPRQPAPATPPAKPPR